MNAGLTAVWEKKKKKKKKMTGGRPTYGSEGQNATGHHWPGVVPGERTMTLMRPTSDEAVQEAIWKLKRGRYTTTADLTPIDRERTTTPTEEAAIVLTS